MAKVRNKKRILLGLLVLPLAVVLACGTAPTKASAMNDVDLSNSWIIITPYYQRDELINKDSQAFGIDGQGAANHQKVHLEAVYKNSGQSAFAHDHFAHFHPKGSKSYNGKYGHKAYTLMDDSYGLQNIFKMLEVEDKSGDSGKSLRGTSKFYDGKNPWQQFEIAFVREEAHFNMGIYHGQSVPITKYTVSILAEKSGKALYYDPNSGRLRVGWDSDNQLSLWVIEKDSWA